MIYRKKTVAIGLLFASALSLYAINRLEVIDVEKTDQPNGWVTTPLKTQAHKEYSQNTPDIVAKLLNGTLSGSSLDLNAWDDIQAHVLETELLQPKKHASLLHELNALYQKTTLAQEKKANNYALYGNEPASPKATEIIHETLKKQNCPMAKVPVYKLTPGKNGAHTKGFTTSCGIWIDESGFLDDEELEYACKHEAGHWYYMHPIEHFFTSNAPPERQEFEADEFALENMSSESKKTLIARAQQKLHPIEDYLERTELVANLKPHRIKNGSFELYKLNLPNKEHATNILNIASR